MAFGSRLAAYSCGGSRGFVAFPFQPLRATVVCALHSLRCRPGQVRAYNTTTP